MVFSLLLFYLSFWDVPFAIAWPLLLLSVITLTGFGLTGYFLNDWADISFDIKVGKTNLVHGVPSWWRPVLLSIIIGVSLFPWFVFFKVDAFSISLIALQLLLQFVYPVPPVRLKDHPVLGIIADSLYAFVIPTVLAWHTFDLTAGLHENWGQWLHFVCLGVWMFAMGVRHILNHHVMDRENDLRTGTPNIALRIAPLRMGRFVRSWLVPAELFAGITFFSILLREDGFLPLVFIGLLSIAGMRHLNGNPPIFLIDFGRNSLDRFASFWLGFVSCIILAMGDLNYVALPIVFVFLFSDLPTHPLVRVAIRDSIRLVRWPIERTSLIFNWSLYYFRKWILGWSEQRNWGVHYPKRLNDLDQKNRRRLGVVAVFNQNFDKYTETFVAGHVSRLPFFVVSFSGWPTPLHVGKMENLISDNVFLQKAFYSVCQFMNSDIRQKENELIERRLLKEGVVVIVAEFGTMGARLVEISRNTGIPLIPIFYGYDAWNKHTVEEHCTSYLELFEIAPLVIGVSRDICDRLNQLGCSKEKIFHLPCYVNLELYTFVDRSFEEPRFLAVGRFCQSKAPFLTILAFNEVVKEIPKAKLTMIGGDDGELETCRSLINSLRLEANVQLLEPMPPTAIREYMASASIFVQHSVTTPLTGDKEGTPVAIMEAMATGLPVISTRHAGIAELIEHGNTGILVDEYDYRSMGLEMVRLVRDSKRMKAIGKAASQFIHTDPLYSDHIGILSSKIHDHIVR